jgi:hypothetical protein
MKSPFCPHGYKQAHHCAECKADFLKNGLCVHGMGHGACDFSGCVFRFEQVEVPHNEECTCEKCVPRATEIERVIAEVCNNLKKMLWQKNKAYGNSALEPIRVFAPEVKEDALIRARMDDKLARIRNMNGRTELREEEEDAYMDLAGYIVLLRVQRLLQESKPKK